MYCRNVKKKTEIPLAFTWHGVYAYSKRMTTVLPEEMEHLKKLARLEMSAAETIAAVADINSILESFEALQNLDLSSYPEMPRPVPMQNIMREDVATPALEQAVVLGVAVEADDGFFKVPRTVES